jgi:hypothetical protein
MASSVPGSVSRMIFFGAARDGTLGKITTMDANRMWINRFS